MASNYPDGSRQTDWELFPSEEDAYGSNFIANSSAATIDQVEDVDVDFPSQNPVPAPKSILRQSPVADEHGSLTWATAGTSTTPTQPSQTYLSSFFARPPENPPITMTATTPARQSLSPSSSPRLPSPPPYTEVQIGPKSPSISERGEDNLTGAGSREDDGSSRRIRPGTKAADMASGPPLIPLAQLDSPFQLQEHLKALYHTYTKSIDGTNTTPITRDTAMMLATPPEGIDRQLWLYELCRFLTMKANNLIIAFFAENPPCSSETCPEMRASEWQYLCAVHEPPKSCCAIDYCCHTLDWATNVLTSPKTFPSRLTLGSGEPGAAQTSIRYLTNIFRRVYRIFAHAWFQHRGVFWQVEGNDGLYIFFKTVCDVYGLIGEDNYTIPAEAEGHDFNLESTPSTSTSGVSILKNNVSSNERNGNEPTQFSLQEPTNISTGATARRHKHTPSTGTNVTTIAESEEDDDSGKHHMINLEPTQPPTVPSQPLKAESKPVNGITEVKPEPTEEATREQTPEPESEPIVESAGEPTPESEEQSTSEPATKDEETEEVEKKEEAEAEAEKEEEEEEKEEEKEDEEAKTDSTDPEDEGSPGPSVETEATEPTPEEAEATTKETLEKMVTDPVHEGAHNVDDVEKREETETKTEEATT